MKNSKKQIAHNLLRELINSSSISTTLIHIENTHNLEYMTKIF
jgi:ribosomal protein L17